MKPKYLPKIAFNRIKGKFLYSRGKLPDFIIVGAQKCGTTTIIKSLEKHPDIAITNYTYPGKAYGEIHFFNKSHMFLNGINWYKSLFDRNKISGEKTPCYMTRQETMYRISQNLPKVKIIVCLRDPIKRIISHLNMVNTFTSNHRSLKDILNNPEFIDRGKYFSLIKNNILPFFDKSRIHIAIVDENKYKQTDIKDSEIKGMKAKDEKRHINMAIDPILEFLDLEKLDIDYDYYYVGKYNKNEEIDTNSINKLKKIYDQENSKLFDFIGRDIESWT